MTQTIQERRANCSPVLIAALTACLSPSIALIYGIRQRSWLVGLSFIIPILVWAATETDLEGNSRLQRKLAAQLVAGALTGAAAYVKKTEANKQLKQAPLNINESV
jgi:hypothetical protein